MKAKDIVIVLLFLPLIVSSQGFPPIPDLFIGVATENGAALALGTSITVEVSSTGEQVGSAQVLRENGYYELQVDFCNKNLPTCTDSNTEDGMAIPGAAVTWKISGVEASYPAPGEIKLSSGGGGFYEDFNIEKISSTPVSFTSSSTITASSGDAQGISTASGEAETSSTVSPGAQEPSSTTVPGILTNLLSSFRGETGGESDELLVASCIDGVRNNGEVGIDCGGPCPSCAGDSEGDDKTLWIIVGGVFAVIMFLVFSLFLVILVYYLAVKKK